MNLKECERNHLTGSRQLTYAIMPVRLTDKMIESALPELMREEDEDKYRALGQLICVWDALVEAAKDEECQS